jgi:hypothetical protein
MMGFTLLDSTAEVHFQWKGTTISMIKKMAALVFGFKMGQPLLLGARMSIEVCTDHKNLEYFHSLHTTNA